jgi:hypothetical protein
MVNYGNGKIYKIVSDQTDKIYIGSTTKTYLSQRMDYHRSDYKKWKNGKHHYVTSFDIVKYDDAEIVLIENFPCKTKDELHQKERQIIEQNKNVCVNKNNPIGTLADLRQQQREWNYRNIEKIKKYYKDNKEKIRKKKSQQIQCTCGIYYSHTNRARHLKSNVHIANMREYIPNVPLFKRAL